MCPEKMHVDQLDIDESLVRRLLAGQFPHWADLSIARVKSAGTENAIYRLGDDLAIRLPYRFVNTTQVDKDHRWLPFLSPHLPLSIPVPVAKGAPAEGYPSQWSVCRWLPGENATLDRRMGTRPPGARVGRSSCWRSRYRVAPCLEPVSA